MKQFLLHIIKGLRKLGHPTPAAPRALSFRPRLEPFEDRLVPSGTPLSADADRSLTTPTQWWWYTGVDANFLAAQAQQNNARITHLEVVSTAPYTFNATLVQNTGDYASGWWWYYGITANDVSNLLTQNQARLTEMETYSVGNQLYFAVLMVPNTGAMAKTWYWYYNVSPSFVATQLNQTNSRLVDLDQEANGNLDVILVANQGNDARAWWYYYNVSPSFVSTQLSTNNARLTDLEPLANGNFDVIMEASQGENWWWYYGASAASLNDLAGRNGARITEVESYTVNGQQEYAALMLNDVDPLTTQVGNILRAPSDTSQVGTYLKEVDGPVVADLQGTRQFEPASMIKVLIHLYAMRQIQAGTLHLTDPITYYYDPNDPTNKDVHPDGFPHLPSNAVTTTIQDALQRMMQNSDNRTTEALLDRFGEPAVNAMAAALGLSSNTVIGSPSPLGDGVPGNFFTLADAGLLYEKVADGTAGLDAANTATFYHLMLDGVDGTLQTVVQQQAALQLNKPIGDPAVQALANRFIGLMQQVEKGGSYTLFADNSDWNEDRTVGGWVSLPVEQSGGIVQQGYVYGNFIDNALNPMNNTGPLDQAMATAMSNAEAELFRPEISAALSTFSSDVAQLSSTSVTEFRPTGTLVGTLGVADSGNGNTFTYSLVSGTGSTDNGSFKISGNQLLTADAFDFAAKSSYSIRIRTTDETGQYGEQTFTITVLDDPALARTGRALWVSGTTGNAAFTFTAGTTQHSMTLNGVHLAVDSASVDAIHFVGGTRNSATLTGSGSDSAVLLSTSVTLSGNGYSVDVAECSNVTVNSGGGNSIANFATTAGKDTFVGVPTYSATLGTGYANYAVGFSQAHAWAGGTGSTAYLATSAGSDIFGGLPAYSFVSGANYASYAIGFALVEAWAGGRQSAAYLATSAGNDTYVGTPTYSSTSGASYNNYAIGFALVQVWADGANSVAYLTTTAGNDSFVGSYAYSLATGSAYANYAIGFANVVATAGSSNTSAYLEDSPGNDTFTGSGSLALLTGPNYSVRGADFGQVHLYKTLGGIDYSSVDAITYVFTQSGDWL